MKYFVVILRWSQTDREVKIVKAVSKQHVKDYFTYENGPRYVEVIAEADKIEEI